MLTDSAIDRPDDVERSAAAPPVILTLIRHGETTANLARLLQGVADSPLTVFGQAQVDALASAFASTLDPLATPLEAQETPSRAAKAGASRLDLPPPTLVVCSPVGRARKTAEAVYKACGGVAPAETLVDASSDDMARTARLLDAHRRPPTRDGLRLIVDPGLAERDFGPYESTRNRQHVAGFERGRGKGEDKAAFKARVRSVGREWIEAATALSQQLRQDTRVDDIDGVAGAQTAAAAAAAATPHLVLVSHGMWISSFLNLHPPTTLRRVPGQPDFLPFAHNTGIFSLSVEAAEAGGVARAKTTLFKANDVQHLANVKRQRGGIGRVAHDERQTKLQGFFAPLGTKRRAEEPVAASASVPGEASGPVATEGSNKKRAAAPVVAEAIEGQIEEGS
ncbi:uncharacterized protein PFL1_00897 [Pseudozyma flocculosa PF-1]|uniref:Phosphoglycerate mutase n=1 Tax=Pseudozyma flocculosa TaxID=84751 RepID=A0A5C3F3U3_9BASI|nr:uncharacterized protein PFL1_00897 [Pseudozyma flocculosa PF-1]EPQ31564.1 hypothetical protein PFL1_00897 [Pseudozyma flocculosa PF-1]SPO38645.1 uncharacterized protein PSFLO_04124 [Pseudozyma flocculosa]